MSLAALRLPIAVALLALAGPAWAAPLNFQPAFHQALRWSVQTSARTTFRQKLPVARAGGRLRVTFRAGEGGLQLHQASVALAGTGGALRGAPVTLRFQGATSVALAAGQRVTSDPVTFPVQLGAELAISADVEGAVAAGAIMTFPDSYQLPGGQALATAPTGGKLWPRATAVDTVEVESSPARRIVAIGDSLTEGYVSGDVFTYVSRTDDYRNAWTAVAGRLLGLSVDNAGVSNQRVRDALAHLDAEVLTIEPFSDCVVLLGTNDLAVADAPAIEADLEALYARLRPHCRVWAVTLPPKERTPTGDLATVQARRRAVNAWLRSDANVFGLLDFERVLAAPTNPDAFAPGLGEDGTHATILGQALMGREAARVLAAAEPIASPPVDDATLRRVLALAAQQQARTAASTPPTEYPRSTRPDGTWTTRPNTDLIGWTQGFFPGLLWQLFESTDDPVWRTRAEVWTRNLELQKTNRQTHDLGFKLYDSFGQAYRLSGQPYHRGVLLVAAESLASRYKPIARVISAADWNPDWKLPLVVDTMVNLELLFWAADNGGRPEWREMALNHALTTAAQIVRPDGSTYHVVDFDPATGAVRFKQTFQGYSDSSTWSRGQAWAIYGFTMAYRYTRDPRMLEAARRVTDYYLLRLPADGVPNWDFDAPSQLKDSSAAAAVASALLELANLVTAPAESTRYRDAALRMLGSLSSPAYLGDPAVTRGLLLHGAGNVPANEELDVSLIYGDYYFVEALLRAQAGRWSRPVMFGSAWRYDDRGVDPGAAWAQPSFNDAAWSSGNAHLGYGDGDERTVLRKTTPSQPSLYFRRHFSLTEPVTSATLRAVHDDGVAVYVNGALVFSRYVANGLGHAAYASAGSQDNELSVQRLALAANPFRVGDNVVAVVVKQAGTTSSDVSFDLDLAVSSGPSSPPPPPESSIAFGATWRYYDGPTDPGSQWSAPGFDDSGWRAGRGQLGYGDGDEATVLARTSPNTPSVYFRKAIALAGPPAGATLKVVHDDGVAVFVNGALVFSKYVAGGLAHAAFASATSQDNELSTVQLPASAFVAGVNVVAVQVKQVSPTSSDLSFDLELSFGAAGGERTFTAVPFGSVWRYDDAGVDRGGGWSQPAYNDAAWREGRAQLGYGDGDEATVLRQGTPSTPTYYFRKRVPISGTVIAAQLKTVRDDGIAVWVNGVPVLRRAMDNGTTFGVYASAGSLDNELDTATLALNPNPFVAGENVIAVMVKQVGPTSSDLSFDLELVLTVRE